MQKQSQFVGRFLALVFLSLSLTLSAGCNALSALWDKADEGLAKAIAKAEKKAEEAAEAEKAEEAKAAARNLLGQIEVVLSDINLSQATLSTLAKEVKPLSAKVAQAAPQPGADAPTPTCFVGLVAVMAPAEKTGDEPKILPLYLVNNQALDDLDHQVLVSQNRMSGEQVALWLLAHSQLLDQLDQLDGLVNAIWAQNPDSATNAEPPVGFLGRIVEMHLDNEERAKVFTMAGGPLKEPVPAWFENASMLGLTTAAKAALNGK